MVAQKTMHTYGVNQVFRFVEGIWSHRKSRHKRPILLHTCATWSEPPSYISTIFYNCWSYFTRCNLQEKKRIQIQPSRRKNRSVPTLKKTVVVRGKYTPPPSLWAYNSLCYGDIEISKGDDTRRGCCIRYPHTVVVVRGKTVVIFFALIFSVVWSVKKKIKSFHIFIKFLFYFFSYRFFLLFWLSEN